MSSLRMVTHFVYLWYLWSLWLVHIPQWTEGNCNHKLSVGLEELEEAKLWKDSEGVGDSIKSGKTHVVEDAFIPACA
jgi:hypothetical protein